VRPASFDYAINYSRYYLNPLWYASLLKRRANIGLGKKFRSKTIYFVPTCDVELDPPWFSHSWESRTDLGLKEGLEQFLNIIQTADASCTFFVEGCITEKYVDYLDPLRNYDIGSHGYSHEAYSAHVVARTARPHKPTLQDRRKYLRLSVEAIRRFCGRSPLSFRAPMLHIDNDSLQLLEEEKIFIDSSISNHFEGKIHPYHPSATNPTKQGNREILEVPVTVNPRPKLLSLKAPYSLFSHPQRKIKHIANVVRIIDSLSAQNNVPTVICTISHVWEFSQTLKKRLGMVSFFGDVIQEITRNFDVTFLDLPSLSKMWNENITPVIQS